MIFLLFFWRTTTWRRKVKKWKWESSPTLCNPMDCPWNSPGQNTGVGSLSLLQGIFPTQEWNQCLLHCRWILYQLSYQGSPTIGGDRGLKNRWPAHGGGPCPTQLAVSWVYHRELQKLKKRKLFSLKHTLLVNQQGGWGCNSFDKDEPRVKMALTACM